MISYPGVIVARFGRYEAVENIGTLERGQLWRAWDPFLERYVVVASLPDVDPVELHRGITHLDSALDAWLGGENPGSILDFAPGSHRQPPYFVFPMPGSEPVSVAPDGSPAEAAPEPPLGRQWSRLLRRSVQAATDRISRVAGGSKGRGLGLGKPRNDDSGSNAG